MAAAIYKTRDTCVERGNIESNQWYAECSGGCDNSGRKINAIGW